MSSTLVPLLSRNANLGVPLSTFFEKKHTVPTTGVAAKRRERRMCNAAEQARNGPLSLVKKPVFYHGVPIPGYPGPQ